jgi:hypothetical protein
VLVLDDTYCDEGKNSVERVELGSPRCRMRSSYSAGVKVKSDHEKNEHEDEGLLEADTTHIWSE